MAAGNSDSGKSILDKILEFKNAVSVFFTPSRKEEENAFKQLYIEACPYCYQPLLATFSGCDNCQHHRILPGTCKLPGCGKPAYYDVNTRYLHKFCGRSHATLFQQQQRQQSHSQGQNTQAYYYWTPQSYGDLHSYSKNNTGHSLQYTQGQQYPQQTHDYQQYNYPQSYSNSIGHNPRPHNGPIFFYHRDEPYYEFTNFYRGEKAIFLDDDYWPTSEHYFQAQKFVGTPYVDWIRCLGSPREAFNLSRDPAVSRWRRRDWEEVKIDVMHKALLAKFTQSEYLRRKLLETGNRRLVERTHRDSFWGDGGDGSGQNHLGKLLMKVRNELRGRGVVGTPVDPNTTQTEAGGDGTTYRRMGTDSAEHSTTPSGGGGPQPEGMKIEAETVQSRAPEKTVPVDKKAVEQGNEKPLIDLMANENNGSKNVTGDKKLGDDVEQMESMPSLVSESSEKVKKLQSKAPKDTMPGNKPEQKVKEKTEQGSDHEKAVNESAADENHCNDGKDSLVNNESLTHTDDVNMDTLPAPDPASSGSNRQRTAAEPGQVDQEMSLESTARQQGSESQMDRMEDEQINEQQNVQHNEQSVGAIAGPDSQHREENQESDPDSDL